MCGNYPGGSFCSTQKTPGSTLGAGCGQSTKLFVYVYDCDKAFMDPLVPLDVCLRSALSPSHHNSLAIRNPSGRCPGLKEPPPWALAIFLCNIKSPHWCCAPIRTGSKDCSTTYSHAPAQGYEDASRWVTLSQNKIIICGPPCSSARGSLARRHTRRPPFQRPSHYF